MKQAIRLPARLLKAAMNYQAKGDVRYYLNGILVSSSGFISATNGHQLFHAQCEEAKELEEDMIFAILGKIPAKAVTANIVFSGEDEGYIWFQDGIERPLKKQDVKQCLFFSVIYGKFPDVDRVLPKGELVPTDQFGINPTYMATIATALRDLGARSEFIKVKLRGNKSSVEISLVTPEHKASVVIMPVRI